MEWIFGDMRIMEITTRLSPIFNGSFIDYPSKEDMCLSLYFSGCDRLCPECQNKELQEPHHGTLFTLDSLINIITKETKRLRTKKVTLLGGDPLYISNREFVRQLLLRTYNNFDYCIYTGYDVGFVKMTKITGFKFLKTGFYDHTLKQESIKTDEFFQLGSKNQKIFDEAFNLLSSNGKLYF